MMKTKIWKKIFIFVLSVTLVAIGTTGYWGYIEASKSLTKSALSHLISSRDNKRYQIEKYFKERLSDAELLASSTFYRDYLKRITRFTQNVGDKNVLKEINDKFDLRFENEGRHYLDIMGVYDIFVIDLQGNILQTVIKEDDLGTNLLTGKYKDSALAHAFINGLKTPSISDTEFYGASNDKISGFFAAPIKDENGKTLGVIASQIIMTELNKIMQERSGLGETGETFLVGSDLFLRSDSRFFEEPTALKRRVDREASRKAVSGNVGTMRLLDYRNIPVLNAYTPVNIPGLNWGLIAKVDENEALAPVYHFSKMLLIGAVFMASIVFFVTYFFTKIITTPINLLSNKLQEIAKTGRYDQNLTITSNDEIGFLVESFNTMSSEINHRTIEIERNQEQLETRVEERTNELRQAKEKAEEAEHNLQANQEILEKTNKEIENQNRLKTGLHQLSASMHGEQDISKLGDNILRSILMFLDLPLGAVYVMNSDNVLQRVTSFGYPENKDNPESFALGTGLIGNAAFHRETITTDNIPEYARITFGIGQAAPRSILVVPLLNNDKVVGALELGSFDRFSSNQLDWLKESESSIALAISSCLTIERRKRVEAELIKLSSAVEQSPAVVVITDIKGNIEYANPRFAELTGYSIEEAIGKNPRILKSDKTPPEVHKELWKTITSGNEWRGEFCNKKKNGELFWEYGFISPVRDNKGVVTNFIAIKEDITEQKKAENRLKAQYIVTQVLAESATITEASSKILQAICTALEWALGEIWIFDSQDRVLKCSEIWHIPSIEISEFVKITRQTTFSPGIGLPGRVLSTAQPVWIEDVVHDSNFQRAEIASKVGLHGVFCFPILSGTEVLGAISFFSHEIRHPDKELLDMMTAIGSQIGLFIKRKQAEEELNSRKTGS